MRKREVISTSSISGFPLAVKLIEYPYSKDNKYKDIDTRQRSDLAMPDIRRGRLKKTSLILNNNHRYAETFKRPYGIHKVLGPSALKKMIDAKGLVTVMEAQ